jgi:predicted amidophosphoribosyltransferase
MDGLITPRPGPGVCPACFNFTQEQDGLRCRACGASESHLDAVVPISYAPAGGVLHRHLADYKRAAEPAVPHLVHALARLLTEFLDAHEHCAATATGVDRFDTVIVVPSGDARRDQTHPLRRIVAELVPETRERFRDVLRASGERCVPHTFDPRRFRALEPLQNDRVLLIDDVWTTGATAQSAAAVLKASGARSIGAVVIGRFVNGYWGGISERLEHMRGSETGGECVVCQEQAQLVAASYTRHSS